MKLIVIGAGAWGTALAVNAAAQERHQVSLWARDPVQQQALHEQRVNARYLGGVPLPPSLKCLRGDLSAALAEQDLLVLAGPVAAARELLHAVRVVRQPVAWLAKGFERPTALAASPSTAPPPPGLMVHEIQAQVAPDLRCGVLSGPSFALEVAQGRPTALVAASQYDEVRQALVQAFHGPTLRVYANDDLVGVEVGGAVKNVLAIATGFCDGLALGLNARAALITRGLAEITRLGVALGARADTFTGLSGLGDLVLTATGDLSRNRKVGLMLAQGMGLQQAVERLGHVAEGVYCARTVVERAHTLGVEMPISQAVVALLDGRLKPEQAVAMLMGREPAPELR
jgi:glycerol-3-phosphate dehydrogenase (NAD(P)+)